MMSLPRTSQLRRLAARIQQIEQRSDPPHTVTSTGWVVVDQVLGGLVHQGTHEWFGLLPALAGHAGSKQWIPPLSVLVYLARRALQGEEPEADPGSVVWIGRRCWPTLWGLTAGDNRESRLLQQSIFVNPADDDTRLWSIDLALRCPAVAAVVADAGGLPMAATRRLQLAAESATTLALLARPPSERAAYSAATTRWLVRRVRGPQPQMSIELLRCKSGLLQKTEQEGNNARAQTWTLQWNRTKGLIALPADVVHRPDQAKVEQAQRKTG